MKETTVNTQDVLTTTARTTTTKDNINELSVTESIIEDIETTLSSLGNEEFNTTESVFNFTPSNITYDNMMDYMEGKKWTKKKWEHKKFHLRTGVVDISASDDNEVITCPEETVDTKSLRLNLHRLEQKVKETKRKKIFFCFIS